MDRAHLTAVASDTIVNAIFVLLFRIQRKLTKYILAQCTVREKLMLLNSVRIFVNVLRNMSIP